MFCELEIKSSKFGYKNMVHPLNLCIIKFASECILVEESPYIHIC